MGCFFSCNKEAEYKTFRYFDHTNRIYCKTIFDYPDDSGIISDTYIYSRILPKKIIIKIVLYADHQLYIDFVSSNIDSILIIDYDDQSKSKHFKIMNKTEIIQLYENLPNTVPDNGLMIQISNDKSCYTYLCGKNVI